jgi:glycosyltransferase involved in cell wall biosynthesis
MNEGVSVIICCYNSSTRLSKTLSHLADQQISKSLNSELIIVDNNSTDNTGAEASRIWKNLNPELEFKIVEEKIPGLAAARERGVKESKYKYVIFCDDDNWLAPNYVSLAYSLLVENQNFGAVGGQSEAVFEDGFQKPDWFDENEKLYAVGRQATQSMDITESKYYTWGAGMAFRKDLYFKVVNKNFPSLLTDRKGAELTSGGDVEMCLRFILAGYRIYYDERLKFKHFVPTNRVNKDYIERMTAGNEKSYATLDKYYAYINLYVRQQHIKRIVEKVKLIVKVMLRKIGIRKFNKRDCILYNIYLASSDREFKIIKRIYFFSIH